MIVLQDHLELAEFCMKRITHAVVCLQDPSQQESPMLLREYTDEMVFEVCKDLRQWMDQLGNLLALYHCGLLDLEKDRRRLMEQLDSREGLYHENEEKRRAADHRYDKLQDIRKEEQMKQRADFLLGLSTSGGDPKIYSQREVDDLKRQWKREHVDPLMADIEELKARIEELSGKLGKRPGKGGAGGDDDFEGGPMKLLKTALTALADRTAQDEISDLQIRLAAGIDGGYAELSDVLKDILKLKSLREGGGAGGALSPRSAAAKKAEEQMTGCINAVAAEMGKLEKGMKELPGLETIGGLAGWARETLTAVAKNPKGVKWKPAPGWQVSDLKSAIAAAAKHMGLGGKGGAGGGGGAGGDMSDDGALGQCLVAVASEFGKLARGFKGLNGGEKVTAIVEWGRDTINIARQSPDNPRWRAAPPWDLDGLGGGKNGKGSDKDLEAMWKARLEALRAEYEEKLRALMAQLEAERARAEEALRKLEEESKRADDLINGLKSKLVQMENVLKKAGLGKQAQDALWESGLAEFLNGRDVFERLYRDATTRMRRLAEAQIKVLQESSADFIRNVQSLYSPLLGDDGSLQYAQGERASGVLFKGSPAVNSPKSAAGGDRSLSPGLAVTRLTRDGPSAARPDEGAEEPPGRPMKTGLVPGPSVRQRAAGLLSQDEGAFPPPSSQRAPSVAGAYQKFAGGIPNPVGSGTDLASAFKTQGYNRAHGLAGPEAHGHGHGHGQGVPFTSQRLARGPAALLQAYCGGGGSSGTQQLPPLECRGSGASPGPTAAAADGCARGSRRSRSPQPADLARPGSSAATAAFLARHGVGGEAPGLVIGGIGPHSAGPGGGGSLLLPTPPTAEGHRGQSRALHMQGQRPVGAHGGAQASRAPAGRLARGAGGAASMPQLQVGPARVLVQSAY